ncbi:hypothetical protein P3102_15535 [Amycolatopsis sp. QT-25]|uniref:hypothetical protein n=1 Tax=Amycolatopsis sp. QT-25 TaxID=3034022 RepID=UPI0023EC2B30|nr:hypothetical protein [Amycolatopsis sp. QT-25]WET82514.1 hypothetical protein P3102_15535 [Amycolatopsis sp. QT-25]
MPGVIELVIPNQAEYFLRNPALHLTGEQREEVIRFGGTYECEHSVFWSSNPRILLLPAGYDAEWFDDVHGALGLQPPPVVSPDARSGLLVRDLLQDGAAQAVLRKHLSGCVQVNVTMTGPTPDIYLLAAMLRGWGLTVELDGVTEEHYWSSLYLDSKVSCLDLARQLPGVLVSDGLIVDNWTELEGAVGVMTARHGRAIVRSLHGVAGNGTLVVKGGGSLDTVAKDSFFTFPLVVQEFIEHAGDVGCPAVDVLVGEDGVEDVVLCSLTVEDGHLFRSVNVGQDALPAVWAERVDQVAHDLGTAARDLGYRGWMCVDCVAGADEKLYVTEINARRSGSTHAGGLLRLWGAERDLTLSAHFMVPVPEGTTYREHIKPVFERLWASGVRAYPTTVRGVAWPDPIIAVIAAAPTADEAERIVAGIREAVSSHAAPGNAS